MASQTIVGPDLQYTQDNKHCFAYSGTFNPTTSPSRFLDFLSGAGYIVGQLEVNADWAGTGGNNVVVEVYFNDIRIIFEQDVANDFVPGDATYKLIIPPHTKVQIDLTGSTAKANANFTGRVYEYLPVRN